MKRWLTIAVALSLLMLQIGCTKEKTDEQELQDAASLIQGLYVMGMMVNADVYETLDDAYRGAPPPWKASKIWNIPEGTDSLYYWTIWPYDSAAVTVDSIYWLVMLSPDIWHDSIPDTLFVTEIDTWWLRQTQNNIWFHVKISFSPNDPLHISGSMKWCVADTWFSYKFTNMGTEDESGEISVTTSPNIKLSAHFLFDSLGAGNSEQNWAKYEEYKFVQYTFFAEPENGYDGYYELASEAWKHKHHFILN